MLASDGVNKTFDAKANGYVRGEGAVALVLSLRSSSDSLAPSVGAEPSVIVRSSAINQDGRTASLTAPNGLSQTNLLKTALRKANLSPGSLDYIETHGTGMNFGSLDVAALLSLYY